MEMIRFGRTELEVSRIAFGGGPLGGSYGDGFDETSAIAAVRRARELGINLFDTARVYGGSEALLGRALRDHLQSDRDQIFIATKGGLGLGPNGVMRDASPKFLRGAVETSLGELGVDYIDIYQVHWPDANVPFAETAGGLQELVDEGKIRHVGVSNFDAADMAEFEETRPVETLQPGYHLLFRAPEEDALPYAHDHDIGVLVYGALGHGLFKGSFDPATDFGERDWRRNHFLFRPETLEQNLSKIAELGAWAEERGYTVRQLAIAWTLAHPAVHTTIVGTTNPKHIEEAAGAASIELDEADLAEIDRILEGAVHVELFAPEMM
jgi:aryl-alcohol dehydrogenase-like predicted oxidoreductase